MKSHGTLTNIYCGSHTTLALAFYLRPFDFRSKEALREIG